MAFYRQILHQKIKLKDLEDFDKSLYDSLQAILDADDASTRDVTFSITGKPKRGWVTLPESIKEEIDYGCFNTDGRGGMFFRMRKKESARPEEPGIAYGMALLSRSAAGCV